MKSEQTLPSQHQHTQPGKEAGMNPAPIYDNHKKGCGKLKGKVALITGGDSGIGRAVATSFAKEGAEVIIVYLNEHDDAKETAAIVKTYGRKALLIAEDISKESNCAAIIEKVVAKFSRIDILVNNAAVQYPQKTVEDISEDQLEQTFRINIFSQFYIVKHALPHMQSGSCIINTASVTAYKGKPELIDYSSTKGAIVSFTRSLSQLLRDREIRVNAVAPGPVWTPLIPSSFSAAEVAKFGKDTMYKRPAQPFEIAPCYVFLACEDSVFVTGQVLHPNGGSIVNS
ncbi:MAG TPA: SDR family oxidoreductase [Panacibacter sp.]|nr:SDR family oxidoreductase [Panacibacter sp.]HNP46487.1 SDR family oxidoreductase [Panacibacter sp.]